MSSFTPKDFEEILDIIKGEINNVIECDVIRSIESNFNTKGMKFRISDEKEGMIIIGEDKGLIAVDITMMNNEVRSFILKDQHDTGGIQNIISWFQKTGSDDYRHRFGFFFKNNKLDPKNRNMFTKLWKVFEKKK